jgi:FkbM family methyltransferase
MFVNSRGEPVDVNFEKEEQMLVRKYLPRNASVLELGARYGTVSCVIGEVLDDPTRHVAVDPDSSIISALEQNRAANRGNFHIYNGVVSEKAYNINFIDPAFPNAEYGTYTKQSTDSTLNNISLKDLQTKYNLRIDYIVADCEGFLCDFIKENEWVLDQLTGIIYERDGHPWKDMISKYEELDEIFKKHGYQLIDSLPHPHYTNNPHFHNVLIKN